MNPASISESLPRASHELAALHPWPIGALLVALVGGLIARLAGILRRASPVAVEPSGHDEQSPEWVGDRERIGPRPEDAAEPSTGSADDPPARRGGAAVDVGRTGGSILRPGRRPPAELDVRHAPETLHGRRGTASRSRTRENG